MTATAVRRLILGTAGHIDHGKTALVERLTGTNADRLPEEQERGMTIDVGYAAFQLPDGTEVGLLDVPGHERLVRTMVAAATAMDLALLVVAADDGPMPQTREHVEILDVLGIKRLVVALTKVDLVDDETCLIAEEEIKEMLAPTGMAGAEIMRVSSHTGAGIEELKATIATSIPKADKDLLSDGEPTQVFRMPVLRSFLVKGRGAVVTGIPISGIIEDGQKIEVMPQGWGSRVRGIQVHHRDSNTAQAGQRTAIALTDIHVDKIKRGMLVVEANTLRPTHRVAAQLRLLGEIKRPLAHGDRARLHLGADQLVVRVHLPASPTLEAGEMAIAEFESDKPFVVAPGDRFVLRMENAQGTLGGGVLIETLDRRLPRKRPGLLVKLLERVDYLDDPEALLVATLESAGTTGRDLQDLVARTGLRPKIVTTLLERLGADGRAMPVGRSQQWISSEAFQEVCKRVVDAVAKLHIKDRAQASLPLAMVRAAVGRMDPTVMDSALQHETAKGTLVRTDAGQIRHRSHSVDLPPEEKERCEKIVKLLAAGGGQPPEVEELEAVLQLAKPAVMRSLRLMESRKLVFRADTWWFEAKWLEQAKHKLREIAEKQGGFTPADARGAMNTTRKWVIPLLEALDKAGFCRRAGNKRVLK